MVADSLTNSGRLGADRRAHLRSRMADYSARNILRMFCEILTSRSTGAPARAPVETPQTTEKPTSPGCVYLEAHGQGVPRARVRFIVSRHTPVLERMESMERMERMESTPAGNGERISLGQEAELRASTDLAFWRFRFNSTRSSCETRVYERLQCSNPAEYRHYYLE